MLDFFTIDDSVNHTMNEALQRAQNHQVLLVHVLKESKSLFFRSNMSHLVGQVSGSDNGIDIIQR